MKRPRLSPISRLLSLFAAIFLGSPSLLTGEEKSPQTPDPAEKGKADDKPSAFLFGWGSVPVDRAESRGGTSTGAPVVLAKPTALPSPAMAAAKDDFERDRAAILSLAGEYRVSFHFLETLGLTENFQPDRPYHSWTTERVHLVEDTGKRISLQHTLEMYFLGDDGKVSEPSLVKHWRQDWTYEDREILAYLGDSTWEKRTVGSDEAKEAWTQAVFQVDDGPRYETLGRWEHRGNLSCWTSDSFLRPLPRREHSVRTDYEVLDGHHRIVLTPTGWLHEQHAWKRVAGEASIDADAAPTFLAAEIGLDRYERITAPELTASRDYWEKTGPYWAIVRRIWDETFAATDRFQLKDKVEGEPLYDRLFAPADAIAEGTETFDAAAAEEEVREAIAAFVERQ